VPGHRRRNGAGWFEGNGAVHASACSDPGTLAHKSMRTSSDGRIIVSKRTVYYGERSRHRGVGGKGRRGVPTWSLFPGCRRGSEGERRSETLSDGRGEELEEELGDMGWELSKDVTCERGPGPRRGSIHRRVRQTHPQGAEELPALQRASGRWETVQVRRPVGEAAGRPRHVSSSERPYPRSISTPIPISFLPDVFSGVSTCPMFITVHDRFRRR